MKRNLLLTLLSIALFSAAACHKEAYDIARPGAGAGVPINTQHPMKDSLQTIIDRYVAGGIPGVQVAVKNADGWYITSGGYAKVEDHSSLPADLVSWYFSLTKTYTAALVMKLSEREQLSLDAPIRDYLPVGVASGITGSERMTVRMLLNHSSGLPNVTSLPAFHLWQLNRPLTQPSADERLAMLYGHPPLFEPGSDFSYSNSNYLLLTLIIEQVSGRSYGAFLRQEILQPLALEHTWYDLSPTVQEELPFPNYYFDRYANAQLENISAWNNALANSCIGYGGIAGTAPDALRFLEALIEGQVVNAASLAEMRTWTQGSASTQPDYGLGLEYYRYDSGEYGHEGDGIGCTTQFFFAPENGTYLYINITVGRQLYGPYLFKTTDLKHELCRYVARWRP